MTNKYPGNKHKAHDCQYCWLVLYSKSALTRHINEEHWRELEKEALEKSIKLGVVGTPDMSVDVFEVNDEA